MSLSVWVYVRPCVFTWFFHDGWGRMPSAAIVSSSVFGCNIATICTGMSKTWQMSISENTRQISFFTALVGGSLGLWLRNTELLKLRCEKVKDELSISFFFWANMDKQSFRNGKCNHQQFHNTSTCRGRVSTVTEYDPKLQNSHLLDLVVRQFCHMQFPISADVLLWTRACQRSDFY